MADGMNVQAQVLLTGKKQLGTSDAAVSEQKAMYAKAIEYAEQKPSKYVIPLQPAAEDQASHAEA